MQTKDESKLINKKKEVIFGTILTITGGILWGISGVCGQFLFQNKEVTASWMVPIRLVTAGLLLLLYYVSRDKGKAFDIWRSKRNRTDIIVYGLAGMMLCQYSYFQTIEWSNAGTATVIQYLGPALIVVWVCLRMKRLPEKKRGSGSDPGSDRHLSDRNPRESYIPGIVSESVDHGADFSSFRCNIYSKTCKTAGTV